MAIKKVYDLSVDLKRTRIKANVPVLVQGDSTEFRLRLLENGKELTPGQISGVTSVELLSGYDAQTIIRTVGTMQGSEAVFSLAQGELFRAGQVKAMVRLADSSDRISTLNFEYQVISDLTANYIPGEQDVSIFQQYIADAQQKIDEMAATDVQQLSAQLADTEQKKADKTELQTESARIDNLVANAGDTDGNAELLDIRVGANGATYDTAGQAIRQQVAVKADKVEVSRIGKDLNDITEHGKNLLDPNDENYLLDTNLGTNGSINADTSYDLTGYIKADSSQVYWLSENGQPAEIPAFYRFAFYDKNYNFLSTVDYQNTAVTPPAGTAFMRVRLRKTKANVVQIELNEITAYESYKGVKVKPDSLPPVDASTIADKSIDPLKVSGSQAKGNLYRESNRVIGKQVTVSGGNLVIGNNASFSYFVLNVEPHTRYIFTYSRFMVLTDANDVPIADGYINAGITSVNTREAVKMYISFNHTLYDPQTYALSKGEVLRSERVYNLDWLQPEKVDPTFYLPPKIYAVQGQTVRIHYDTLPINTEGYKINITGNIGKMKNGRWEYTASSAGTFPISVELYKDYKLISKSASSIIVKAANPAEAKTVSALFIGDSTLHSVMSPLSDLAAADEKLTVNLIGTRSTGGVLSEGRAGWNTSHFLSFQTVEGTTNPFYNNGGFDFNYYLTNNGFTAPDVVAFNLGTNDTFSAKTDSEARAAIETAISNLNAMIANIKSVNASTKIAVHVTIPPNGDIDAFGEHYGVSQTEWRYKRNNELWCNELVKRFGASTTVDLVPINLGIERKTMFLDGVHPNSAGYNRIAEMAYAYLK